MLPINCSADCGFRSFLTDCLSLQMKSKSIVGCDQLELWSKPLKVEGSSLAPALAVLLVNNGLPAKVSFSLAELGIKGKVSVRDVWNHRDAGVIEMGGQRSVPVGVHDSKLYVLKQL